GAERGFPARDHAAAFAYAAQHGMACTCHAGEGDGPDSIHQALHQCGAQRIGHGTRLGEDPALLAYVIERKIPLEMCLTSNLHTHTVASLAEHPFKRYLDQGVVVTLNTDGRLVDGISLTDEYFVAFVCVLAGFTLPRFVWNTVEGAVRQEPKADTTQAVPPATAPQAPLAAPRSIPQRLTGIFGIALILGIGIALSRNRGAISWR